MSEQNGKPKQNVVTLVEDPFSIPTLEVSEAQHKGDDSDLGIDKELENFEGDLDLASSEAAEVEDEAEGELKLADPAESDAALEKLAAVMGEHDQKALDELQVAAEGLEADSAERLAQEIAEDQALQRQLAEEQKELEKEIDAEFRAALPQVAEDGSLDVAEMESCIEALLFMSDKPVSVNKLREYLGEEFSKDLFTQAIESMRTRYQGVAHGFELAEVGGGFQFRTKPGRAALAKKLAKVQTQRLSSGGMETLAIVAYKQPVMKDDIDKIRGVDSSYFIRGLLDKKLIRISGRSELPGRPMLYSTTPEFLELFGLADLNAMPSLRELEQMVPASQANAEEEDPRLKEMRRLVQEMKSDNSTLLNYDPKEDEKILKSIREKVSAIPTSTPYLEEQKAAEKLAREGGAPAVDPNPLKVEQASEEQPALPEQMTQPEEPMVLPEESIVVVPNPAPETVQ